MRNNNPDIIIHSLVKRNENRRLQQHMKFDVAEKMRIEQQRLQDLKEKHDRQKIKEAKGHFVTIERGNFKCRILVKEDEDEAEVIKRFIEKMEKQGRKLV